MSMPENVAGGRRGHWIAMIMAGIALVLSIRPYFAPDQRVIPRVTHIGLRDEDRGENIGVIRAEYAQVTIKSISQADAREASIVLTPTGVTIAIKKGGSVVKFWEFNEKED
jgi:hypothetical protein